MLKNLYLVRHGETLFNQRNIIQGVVNAPLVLDGVAQAIHTRKAYFESRNIHFDHVYCSPEGRCIQTTQLLTTLPYTKVTDLHEMCFGKLEGCPGFLAAPASEFATYYANYGGETLAQVQERMNRALLEIMNPNNSWLFSQNHFSCFVFGMQTNLSRLGYPHVLRWRGGT